MGEAKFRRRMELGPNSSRVSADAPQVRELLRKDEPINVHLIGAMRLVLDLAAMTKEQFMAPEHHFKRLAFQCQDRIRTGEIDPWQCSLCEREFNGGLKLSCTAVIERMLGDPTPKKPGIVMPICHGCDSVSTEETQRLVMQYFGLLPLQVGHA
jgi:hypothetical protein